MINSNSTHFGSVVFRLWVQVSGKQRPHSVVIARIPCARNEAEMAVKAFREVNPGLANAEIRITFETMPEPLY